MSGTTESNLALINTNLEKDVEDLNNSNPTNEMEEVKANQVFLGAVKLHMFTIIF
jgi:hypothetical protein